MKHVEIALTAAYGGLAAAVFVYGLVWMFGPVRLNDKPPSYLVILCLGGPLAVVLTAVVSATFGHIRPVSELAFLCAGSSCSFDAAGSIATVRASIARSGPSRARDGRATILAVAFSGLFFLTRAVR